jgi:hypothetical protein
MFRIGGEEDLLDLPTPGALDAPAPESPARRTERTEPISARVPESSRSAVEAPPSRRRRREPRADQQRHAGRRDRSTAPPTRRQRPGLTGLHSWIAWVNAAILTLLIVAAVIGHDPPSTTAVGRAPSTATRQAAAAQTVASSVGARPATTRILPKPLAHRRHSPPSHSPRPRVAVQAHLASEAPTDRPPPAPTPQGGSASPPAAIAQPVASSSAPAPRSVAPPSSQHRRDSNNSQNAAAIEFAP